MLFYQGFAAAIISVASPWIGKSFHLDGAGIARLFAWISLSAFGALALSRMIDRYGRRRMILWCVAAIPVCSIGAAIATSLLWFAIFQIALYAMVGAAGSGCVVMLSEELPIARRARGQSFGGLAAAVGAGLCVFLMPIFDAFGWSWRWMFVISAAGIAILPAMARLLPESERWELSDASGINTRTRFYDVFQPLYRKRSITMILCALAGNISTTAANAFGYYHAVSVVGMSAAATSTMTIVAGGLGLLGFPLGAWTSERFGRVPTIVSVRNRDHRRTPMVLLGPAAAFRMAVLVAGQRLLLVQRMRQRRHRRRQRRRHGTIPNPSARHNDRMVRAGRRHRLSHIQRRRSTLSQQNGRNVDSSRRIVDSRNPRRHSLRPTNRRNPRHVLRDVRQGGPIHLRELIRRAGKDKSRH